MLVKGATCISAILLTSDPPKFKAIGKVTSNPPDEGFLVKQGYNIRPAGIKGQGGLAGSFPYGHGLVSEARYWNAEGERVRNAFKAVEVDGRLWR